MNIYPFKKDTPKFVIDLTETIIEDKINNSLYNWVFHHFQHVMLFLSAPLMWYFVISGGWGQTIVMTIFWLVTPLAVWVMLSNFYIYSTEQYTPEQEREFLHKTLFNPVTNPFRVNWHTKIFIAVGWIYVFHMTGSTISLIWYMIFLFNYHRYVFNTNEYIKELLLDF